MTIKCALLAMVGILLAGSANAGLVTYRAHGPINQIVDFSETDFSSTTSTTWVDVPNASLKLVIPEGPVQLVMVRFTAEADCFGPTAENYCAARILAGNSEMLPNSGADYAMEVVTVTNADNTAGAAMDRSLALHPGTYTIKVQYEASGPNNTFRIDDWHLNVMTADYGAMPGTAPEQADPGSRPIVRH